MIKPLIKIDELNSNSRIYTKECIDKIIEEFNKCQKDKLFVYKEFFDLKNLDDLSKTIGIVKDLFIKNDILYGDIFLFESLISLTKEIYETGDYAFAGTGKINENREIYDYKLYGLFFTMNPSFKF